MSKPEGRAGGSSTCEPVDGRGRMTSTPRKCSPPFPSRGSVELATRLHANRNPAGLQLAEWLVNQVPEPARAELRHLTRDPGAVGRAAGDLLGRLPAVPTQRVEISVLGPLTVAYDGVRVTTSELRRSRVRTLLALLAMHGTLTRNVAIELLWPEQDTTGGARNLRVTLTYLRQLLEPDRPSGEASFHVRADADTITLHRSDYLVVDLWELRRLNRDADVARERGDIDRTIALLDTATAWWRGDPMPDLASVVGQEHEVERVRLLQLDCLLEFG